MSDLPDKESDHDPFPRTRTRTLHPYFVCDVFTSQPLQGNQLDVFVDGRPFTPEQMQSLARIFAPESELPFAGHPVLGTPFVVSTALGKENVVHETGAGLVPVRLELSDGGPVFGRMQQPIHECEPSERERELLESEDEVAAVNPDFAAWKAGHRRELLRRLRRQLARRLRGRS